MFLGLKDLSPDLFFDVDDNKIELYLKDIRNMPELTNILPMGSFGADEKIKFTILDLPTRLEVGNKFLIRDNYAVKKYGVVFILRDIFLQEFSSIPKLVTIFEELPEASKNLKEIPLDAFTTADLYYMIILYFSSTYRETTTNKQLTRQYHILTDVDMELNNFLIITKVSTFFFSTFQNYLAIVPGQIPFMNDFGTTIKEVVQTKNNLVQRVRVENEINYFIEEFNLVYTDQVEIESIQIENNISVDAGDTWTINVNAYILEEYIQFKIIV